MKHILIAIIVLASVSGTGSAASLLNPAAVGADMVADGIDMGVTKLADGIMNVATGSNGTQNGTTTPNGMHRAAVAINQPARDPMTQFIINFATWQVQPFSYPYIQQMMGFSLCIACVIMFAYVCLGAFAVAAQKALSNRSTLIPYLTNGGGTGAMHYMENVIKGCLSMSFIVLFIWTVLLAAFALKLMIMNSIANSISPSYESSSVMYLMMAIMWLVLSLFFAMSNIVICLTAACSFIIGALNASDKTNHLSKKWMEYFMNSVIMQVFVIAVTATVVGFMMDIKTSSAMGALMPQGAEMGIYIALILFLVVGCYRFMFGKINLVQKGTKFIKLIV